MKGERNRSLVRTTAGSVQRGLGCSTWFLGVFNRFAMAHRYGTAIALFAALTVHAQLQQTCMVVQNGFYHLSEAGFVQTADGGFASAGPFSESNDGYNETGVTRFDADGNVLWMRKWTTGPNTNFFPQALVATADGGLVLAGIDQVTGPQNGWFIIKLDATGTLQWAKNYASPDFSLIGSLYSDGFIQTNDGGFAMIAHKSFPNRSYCMLRTDADGNLLWSDEIRYTGVPSDVAELPNGDLIFTGWQNGLGVPPLTLRKDGLTGETEWMHWHTSVTDVMDVHGVAVGPDSTIVLTGICSGTTAGEWSHLGAMALNAQGTPLWMTKVHTSDQAVGYQITPHPAGGYVVVGLANRPFPELTEIAPTVTKLSDDGQLEWSKRYPLTPGMVSSWFSRVNIAADGDLLVTGRTAATDNYVQRLLKLAPDGTGCAYCPSQDTGSYQALEPMMAADQGNTDAGPWAVESPITLTMTDLTATVLADVCGATSIAEVASDRTLIVSPNPLVESATVHVPSATAAERAVLRLVDATGRVVRTHPITGTTLTLMRGDLAAGSYIYQLVGTTGILAAGKVQVAGR